MPKIINQVAIKYFKYINSLEAYKKLLHKVIANLNLLLQCNDNVHIFDGILCVLVL